MKMYSEAVSSLMIWVRHGLSILVLIVHSRDGNGVGQQVGRLCVLAGSCRSLRQQQVLSVFIVANGFGMGFQRNGRLSK